MRVNRLGGWIAGGLAAGGLACAPKSSSAPTCAVPAGSSVDAQQLEVGNTAFALQLLPPLTADAAANGGANAFYSPYSISTALAMAAAGAQGSTATQLWSTLGLPGTPGDASATGVAFANLDCSVRGDGNSNGNQVNLANAIYGQSGFPFVTAYLSVLDNDYGAPLQTEDFETNSAKAIQDINGWVSNETAGKIPQLVSSSSVDTSTRLLLVNAIYFKGSWRTQFDPTKTASASFGVEKADNAGAVALIPVNVPTMNALVADAGYATGDGFAVAELPYTGGTLAMDIVLPSSNNSLVTLESQLDGGAVLAALGALKNTNLQVALPRFQITQSINLVPVLQRLGIQDAFTSAADFSGIDGAHDLQISAVIHQAVVEVDETGSTAAAATAVTIGANAVQEPQVIDFTVNHSFLFFIRDLPTGTILFAGQVEDPSVVPAPL